jgi:hypothetical protein
MFTRGSRYRNLRETVVPEASGAWIRGKELRRIPPREALLAAPGQQVTHIVLDGERLDLLAFKYYRDTTRWWQIGDVNPEYPFPTDLLGQAPLVEEEFRLEHAAFSLRLQQLRNALAARGTVADDEVSYFEGSEPARPVFGESTVVVTYPTSDATRQGILADLQGFAFRLQRAFAWVEGANTNEAFTFEDIAAKRDWQELLRGLAATPGVRAARPDTAELTVHVAYNGELVRRESLAGLIGVRGFVMADSAASSRVGARILIPPSQIV